jgi:hypothetical protein
MSQQTESSSTQTSASASAKMSTANASPKKLYSEHVHAELEELQSDIDVLFQQLQSLSRQRLTTAGSVR